MTALASPKSREMDEDSRFKISLEKLFRAGRSHGSSDIINWHV
jgi:hypothetical protein